MENPTISDPTWKNGSEERTQREAVPQRPSESADRKKRHVPQVRQWGRRLGTEMFDSYEKFISLSLLHDDEEDASKIRIFRTFLVNIDEMLQEIT